MSQHLHRASGQYFLPRQDLLGMDEQFRISCLSLFNFFASSCVLSLILLDHLLFDDPVGLKKFICFRTRVMYQSYTTYA